MKNPKAKLHRPVEALRRVQLLVGTLKTVSSDRNENRAVQIDSVSNEIFDVVLAALNGGPLPPKRDHSKAI